MWSVWREGSRSRRKANPEAVLVLGGVGLAKHILHGIGKDRQALGTQVQQCGRAEGVAGTASRGGGVRLSTVWRRREGGVARRG